MPANAAMQSFVSRSIIDEEVPPFIRFQGTLRALKGHGGFMATRLSARILARGLEHKHGTGHIGIGRER